jgi:hypothetical protein
MDLTKAHNNKEDHTSYRKDPTKKQEKAIGSSVTAAAQEAESASIFISAGDSTTWLRENENLRDNLCKRPPPEG